MQKLRRMLSNGHNNHEEEGTSGGTFEVVDIPYNGMGSSSSGNSGNSTEMRNQTPRQLENGLESGNHVRARQTLSDVSVIRRNSNDASVSLMKNVVTEQEVAMLYEETHPKKNHLLEAWKKVPGAKMCSCCCKIDFDDDFDTESQSTRRRRRKEESCSYQTKKHAKGFFPFVEWLPKYDFKENLKGDVIAGVTVGIILIPQGISYGLLADLPAQYGLYACLVAPVVYGLLGTCVQLQIGPFAIISLLIASTVGDIVDPDEDQNRYIEAVLTCSLLVGIFLSLLSFLQLGSLVNFLAMPVISGLTTGGAFLIVTSQMSHFFGITIPRGNFFPEWVHIFEQLKNTNVAAFLIGIISYIVLTAFREFKTTDLARRMYIRNLPIALIVMVVSTVITWGFDLHDKYGVKVLGEVESGIPAPHFPTAFDIAGELIVPVVVISIVGYAMSIATSKTFAAKNNYEVSSNQELFALGIANFLGGIFNGHPAFSSLSRTAIVHELGAKTPFHNVVSSCVIIFVLYVMTAYLENLPYSCLSAIIFDSLKGLLMQVKEVRELWRSDKRDLSIWLVTFFAVLLAGITYGLAVGVGYSIIVLLYTVSHPHYAVMGRFPKMPNLFKDLRRFGEAVPVPGVVVFRFDSALHFANREDLRVHLMGAVEERIVAESDRFEDMVEEGRFPDNEAQEEYLRRTKVHSVVLDASSITDCDTSGLKTLAKIQRELDKMGVELIMCHCRGHFRDILKRSGICVQEYVTMNHAVYYAENKIVDLNTPPPIIEIQENRGLELEDEDEDSTDRDSNICRVNSTGTGATASSSDFSKQDSASR